MSLKIAKNILLGNDCSTIWKQACASVCHYHHHNLIWQQLLRLWISLTLQYAHTLSCLNAILYWQICIVLLFLYDSNVREYANKKRVYLSFISEKMKVIFLFMKWNITCEWKVMTIFRKHIICKNLFEVNSRLLRFCINILQLKLENASFKTIESLGKVKTYLHSYHQLICIFNGV